jgi:hypothetical protein
MAVITDGFITGGFYNGWLLQRMSVTTDGAYSGWLLQRMAIITDFGGWLL